MTIWSHETPVPGTFNDGAFPVDRDVLVRQTMGELLIEDEASGEVLARWPLGTLRPVPEADYPNILRLRQSEGEGGRLAIFDPEFNEGLTEWWPNLRRRLVLDRATLGAAARVSLAAFLGLGFFFLLLLPVLGRLAAHVVPPALERQVAAVFLRHGDPLLERINAAPVCEGAAAAPVLENLVERLRKASGWPGKIRVRVIDETLPNAATIPGGEIVVFRGMLHFARNGDELAGILAHEIGHVQRRHAVRNLFVTSMNFFGFDQLLGNFSGQLVVHPVGGLLLIRREARNAEHEADRSAVEILDKAGVNIRPFADILDRVSYLQGEREMGEGWLATHPVSHARARSIRDAAPEEARPPALTAAEFSRLRAICAEPPPEGGAPGKEPSPDPDETEAQGGAAREGEPSSAGPAPVPSEDPDKEGAEEEDPEAQETPGLEAWDTGGGE